MVLQRLLKKDIEKKRVEGIPHVGDLPQPGMHLSMIYAMVPVPRTFLFFCSSSLKKLSDLM